MQVNAYAFTFHDDEGVNKVYTMLPLIDLANHADAGASLPSASPGPESPQKLSSVLCLPGITCGACLGDLRV